MLPLLLACSDGGGATDPGDNGPHSAVAVITGPDQVILGCFTGAVGEFDAYQSSGPITAFSWEVDGAVASHTSTLRRTFEEPRDYTVTLKALSLAGTVIATALKTVTALPPANIAECLGQRRILGREGILLRTGHASVTAEYTLSAANVAHGAVDSYTWTLLREGGEPSIVGSGPGVQAVEVEFDEGGAYEVGVQQLVGGDTVARTLSAKVYTGEPVSEPGKILLFNHADPFSSGAGRSGSGRGGLYFMDGETGHVSGPLLESADIAAGETKGAFHGAGTCDTGRVVLAYIEDWTVSHKTDLWQVNHDGIGLTELVDAVGIVQHPAISVRGDIAYVDDTRWGFCGG